MSTVFKNRWMALVWSAGIIWFAVDYAGNGSDTSAAAAKKHSTSTGTQTQLKDASGRPITAEELAELNGGTDSK